jgi:hypothetical protein
VSKDDMIGDDKDVLDEDDVLDELFVFRFLLLLPLLSKSIDE